MEINLLSQRVNEKENRLLNGIISMKSGFCRMNLAISIDERLINFGKHNFY